MAWVGTRSFSRNSIFNFLTQAIIIIIGFISVPYIISKLGSERFGLLSILWLFIGYFNFFDLGIGQATVKFLSEAIAKKQLQHAANLIRSSLKLGIMLGVVGCIIVLTISWI